MTEKSLKGVHPSSTLLYKPGGDIAPAAGQMRSHIIRVGVPPKEIGHLDDLAKILSSGSNAAGNPTVILRLQALSRMDLEFSPTISAKNLKTWGAVLDSICTFSEEHSSLLEASGMRSEAHTALQNKMVDLKNKLVEACLVKLRASPPISSNEAREIGDVLARAVSSLTDEGKNTVFLELQEALDRNPALKKPLTKASNATREQVVEIAKEQWASGTAAERVGDSISHLGMLQDQKLKLKAVRNPDGGAPTYVLEEQACAGGGKSLKSRITSFFNRVGRSAESQQTSDVLLSGLEERAAYFRDNVRHVEDPQFRKEAISFLRDCVRLYKDDWFQGVLRHNRELKSRFFEGMKVAIPIFAVCLQLENQVGSHLISEDQKALDAISHQIFK